MTNLRANVTLKPEGLGGPVESESWLAGVDGAFGAESFGSSEEPVVCLPVLGKGRDRPLVAVTGYRGFRQRPVWDYAVGKTDLCTRALGVTGYEFRDVDLLVTSLTHASVAHSRIESNERLEFLGDAILGVVVCAELYRRFETWLEGDLTKAKSVLVSRRVCAEIADSLGLTDLLILGNGIDARQNLPLSLRAAVLESVIGAIFLDGGIEAAKEFILRITDPYFEKAAANDDHDNYKSSLQHYAQRHLSSTPHYDSLDEQGPDHSKCFEVCVVIDGVRYPSAWGPTKKAAEQEAANRALQTLTNNSKTANPPSAA